MDDQDPQITDAEARTRLAEDRTILANERTYSAWVRTGLAALAAGVAFERFLTGTMPDWILSTIAVVLIVFSFCAFVLAIWHYTHLGLRVQRAEIHKLPIKSLAALDRIMICRKHVMVSTNHVNPIDIKSAEQIHMVVGSPR